MSSDKHMRAADHEEFEERMYDDRLEPFDDDIMLYCKRPARLQDTLERGAPSALYKGGGGGIKKDHLQKRTKTPLLTHTHTRADSFYWLSF